jgi:hypothetical protein
VVVNGRTTTGKILRETQIVEPGMKSTVDGQGVNAGKPEVLSAKDYEDINKEIDQNETFKMLRKQPGFESQMPKESPRGYEPKVDSGGQIFF